MDAFSKYFYSAGLEDEFIREMCIACRINGVDVPLREIADAFMKALGRDIVASHWIKPVARPVDVQGWITPLQCLLLLKLSNLGMDNGLRADDVTNFWLRYHRLNDHSQNGADVTE